MNKNCPHCHVSLTKAEWADVRSRSSLLGGRFVWPCRSCETLLRLSRMTYVWWAAAFATLLVDLVSMVAGKSSRLSLLHFFLGLAVFVAFSATRFEVVPLDYGGSKLHVDR
jgi:hypothetical protein